MADLRLSRRRPWSWNSRRLDELTLHQLHQNQRAPPAKPQWRRPGSLNLQGHCSEHGWVSQRGVSLGCRHQVHRHLQSWVSSEEGETKRCWAKKEIKPIYPHKFSCKQFRRRKQKRLVWVNGAKGVNRLNNSVIGTGQTDRERKCGLWHHVPVSGRKRQRVLAWIPGKLAQPFLFGGCLRYKWMRGAERGAVEVRPLLQLHLLRPRYARAQRIPSYRTDKKRIAAAKRQILHAGEP